MRIPVIIASALLVVAGCTPDRWEGFVYPDAEDLSSPESIGTFSTLAMCRAEASKILERHSGIETGGYECGLNCQWRADQQAHHCETTER